VVSLRALLRSSEARSLEHRAIIIVALGSITPLLILSYAFYRTGLLERAEVPLLIAACLGICYLAYVMMRHLMQRVARIAEELSRIRGGEEVAFEAAGEFREFGQMKEIAGSFNKLLVEFKNNTRCLEDLIYKLSSLSELTELASRIPEAEHMLQVVLQRTMAAVDATMGSVMLLEPGGRELKVAAAQGHPEVIVGSTLAVGEGIAGQVAETGETVLVADIETDERFRRKNDPKYETGSFICMPLKVNSRVIGVLNLARKGNLGTFEEADIKFLSALMNHIGFALEHTRLLREAKEAALRLEGAVEEKTSQLDLAQRQVIQAEKLSALGELVASIVHELNNPLTGIMGYSQLLLQRENNPKNERDLQRIFSEAQRASRIVHNLLSFARKRKPERRPSELNEIVAKVLDLRSYDLRLANVGIEYHPQVGLPRILADENQIQQVLLNLLNNAQQAVAEKEGGKVTVRTWTEAGKVLCSVQDNGVGIPADHADRVFDPFFTTKEQGKGTGLGLSISYGIIREHGGQIYFESSPDKGATFYIELPLLDEAAVPDAEPEASYQQASRLPIKRVLVVDDEQVILDLLSEVLSAQGHRVDTALSAKSALVKLAETDYDMIICDVRMPGMDGSQLYEQVKKSRPELARRFVFSTGDVIGQRTREFLKDSGTDWLRKPFTGEQLMDVLTVAWQRINAN
jgi:signal transduction histidine kinase/ActR/RegA family two-component response regulator